MDFPRQQNFIQFDAFALYLKLTVVIKSTHGRISDGLDKYVL